MVSSGKQMKLLLVSPHKYGAKLGLGRKNSVEIGSAFHHKLRSSGYGKDTFRDAPVKKSNLVDRKQEVLRIAAENFRLVNRLSRVRSAVSRHSSRSDRSSRSTNSRPNSAIAKNYPNVTDPKNLKFKRKRSSS